MKRADIIFVKESTQNAMTYEWYVKLKGHDSRTYINYKDGRTVAEEYSIDRLPAAVRSFINSHKAEQFSSDEYADATYTTYIYR